MRGSIVECSGEYRRGLPNDRFSGWNLDFDVWRVKWRYWSNGEPECGPVTRVAPGGGGGGYDFL